MHAPLHDQTHAADTDPMSIHYVHMGTFYPHIACIASYCEPAFRDLDEAGGADLMGKGVLAR